MKKLIFLLFVLFALQAESQNVTFAGKRGGWITQEELLSKHLELSKIKGTVVKFDITATIDGFDETERSMSSRLSVRQKQLIKKILPSNPIWFDNIKVKLANDSIVSINSSIIFRKDGPMAMFSWKLFNKQEYNINIYDITKNPNIYVVPNHLSKDTSQYFVTSFKIKSTQPDFYYLLESSTSRLTPEMIDFMENATYNFEISNIIADDKKGNKIKLANISVETQENKLLRTKSQLLKSKRINFISPISGLKVISFELRTNIKSDKYNYVVITETGNTINSEMKKYLSSLNIGENVEFRLNCINKKGGNEEIRINVRLIE